MSKQKNKAYNKPKKLVEVLRNEPPQSQQVNFVSDSTRLEYDNIDDTLIRLNRIDEEEERAEEEKEFLKPAPILIFFLLGIGLCGLLWWLFFQGIIKVFK